MSYEHDTDLVWLLFILSKLEYISTSKHIKKIFLQSLKTPTAKTMYSYLNLMLI